MTEPNSAASRDIRNNIHPYTNLALHPEVGPHIVTSGKGVYVYDDDGKEYIEGMSGLWCTSLGFGEDELIEAAVRQMRALPSYHGFFHKSVLPVIDLAEKLIALAPVPMSKVFFANSGSEANDSLIKIVWYVNNALGRPRKKKIISRIRAYHGVTIAAASLTGIATNHRDFDLPIANILHTDCPHHYRFAEPGESEEEFATRLADRLEQLILDEDPETVAAFIAEPVMGAGGVIVPPATYFDKVQAVLKRYDVMLLDDEVITGFGRIGTLWGAQAYGLAPDAITVAKALSSAYLPISAVLLSEAIYEAMVAESRKIGTFAHGFTYSGHPVPAAVALRTLELYEERDVLGHVQRIAPHFQRRLRALADHPLVGEARGVGLIGALELVADKATKRSFEPAHLVGGRVAEHAKGEGLIIRALQDTIAFCPPLIITEAEIDELFDRVGRALDAGEAWVAQNRLREAA